jgi:GST-like protein
MIDLYYYKSPNARKIHIALEEMGLPYEAHWVDISAGDQFKPSFLRVSPNNKVPAIVDHDGPQGRAVSLFESGAILLYLAEKSGQLLPVDAVTRQGAIAWLFWQVANQGPMLGQAAHFVSHAQKRAIHVPYAIERFSREAERCYSVLNSQLEDRTYIVGEYSIADVACYPWTRVHKGQGVDLAKYPNVLRWSDMLSKRPVYGLKPQIEMDMAARTKKDYRDDESWKVLFGAGQQR